MKDLPDMGQSDKSTDPQPVIASSHNVTADGRADGTQTAGEVETIPTGSHTVMPPPYINPGDGVVAATNRGEWSVLNFRWWALAAFIAFVLSRLSTL
jgi:hypothetical protein